MSGPQPPTALEGHCSAINDDTLYVLSPNAFQSLSLRQNATWSQEKLGQPVTGASCVKAGDGDNASLFVIGGTSSNDSYSGLQVYSFANKQWTSVALQAPVLQNRVNHSAAYLQDSSTILIYAGSQPDTPSLLSSQTFLLGLAPQYTIDSYTSQAPTANLPNLLPWNGTTAALVGGNPWTTDIWLFSPATGWSQYATTLAAPVPPASRGTIIDGGDGSKVLQLIDFSVSPNNLTNIVLQGTDGEPAATGQLVGGSSGANKRKRDLTLSDWPTYNSTGAPTATRADCSIATNADGLAVVAAGSSDTPIVLFNQSQNSWVDVSRFFGAKDEQQPLQPSSSQPSSTSPTSSSASSTSAPASSGNSSHRSNTNRILGITLGVIFGVAALFVIILLLLRWRKRKQQRENGYTNEKRDADRMSFQDRGASFMKEAGGSINNLALMPPPNDLHQENGSHSSLAIISGRFGGSRRNTRDEPPRPSYESTAQLVKNKNGDTLEMQSIHNSSRSRASTMSRTTIGRPYNPSRPLVPMGNAFAVDENVIAESSDSIKRNRSSGWSKYFAAGQPPGLSNAPAAYTQRESTRSSNYTTSDSPRIPSSIIVPPLDIDFTKGLEGQGVSRVPASSPSFNDSREDMAKRGTPPGAAYGQKGVIEDASRTPSRTTASSGIYERPRTTDSNLTADFFNGPSFLSPPPKTFAPSDHSSKSSYGSSVATNEQRLPSRGKGSGFFPGPGTSSYRAPKARGGDSSRPGNEWRLPQKVEAVSTPQPLFNDVDPIAEHANSRTEDVVRPVSPPASPARTTRNSNLTIFPRGASSGYYASRGKEPDESAGPKKKPMSTDVSWLDISQQ